METPGNRLLRHSGWDALLVALALLHGIVLCFAPSILVVGVCLWWNANTISHNFIHLPFFRSRRINHAFSLYLTLLLGLPQTLWSGRHLAHHGQRPWRLRFSRLMFPEIAALAILWLVLIGVQPRFFFLVYLPGILLGLGLCQLHGYFEHARGTVSHHGGLYNALFFNDGYHVEHHLHPREHWRRLRLHRPDVIATSRWPSVLRWVERCSLDSLECLVLRSRLLQCFVLNRHERAFRRLLHHIPRVRHVGIVGGGLFPRTALVLRRLLPAARFTVIDANPRHLDLARKFLPDDVSFVQDFFEVDGNCSLAAGMDLVIIPLAFRGDRRSIYQRPPAPSVLVQDWLWRRQPVTAIVSIALLKRMNLVRQ